MDRARGALRFVAAYAAILLLGTGALSVTLLEPRSWSHVFFEAASALGNVGLSSGITDATLPAAAKATLILLMWMGRLEILGVLLLMGAPFSAAAAILDADRSGGGE